MLSGNAKTVVLEHISPHRFFRHDAERTLGVGQKALNINTICRRLAVPLKDMRFLESTQALGQAQSKQQQQQEQEDGNKTPPRQRNNARESKNNGGGGGSGGGDKDDDNNDDDDDSSNDLLMEALYASPKDAADAKLKPFKSPSPSALTRQQREELGIFVLDDDAADNGTASDGDDDHDDDNNVNPASDGREVEPAAPTSTDAPSQPVPANAAARNPHNLSINTTDGIGQPAAANDDEDAAAAAARDEV